MLQNTWSTTKKKQTVLEFSLVFASSYFLTKYNAGSSSWHMIFPRFIL